MKKIILGICWILCTSVFATFDFNQFNGVVLLDVQKSFGKFYCTGVAINHRRVLTAAHCLEDAQSINVIFDYKHEANSPTIRASYWRFHPKYNPSKSIFHYDIGVIALSERAPSGTIFYKFGTPDEASQYLRFGYGAREGRNRRTVIGDITLDQYDPNQAVVYYLDTCGVSGDSGGPVYKILANQSYELISIHSTADENGLILGPVIANLMDWLKLEL